jgi:hypothetical protein
MFQFPPSEKEKGKGLYWWNLEGALSVKFGS